MNLKEKNRNQKILDLAHHDHEKGLTVHAFYKTHNHSTSDDLVQDTFMKTWRYLMRGGKIEIMKAFLYHVLNNLIIDEYRKRKNNSLDLLIEKGFDIKEDTTENMINFLDGKKALLLITRLPPAYQKVMRMKYVQDLTLTEMSIITGSTKNSLAVKLHRGLEKIKVLYNQKTP